MIYRKFKGDDISLLGFGFLRPPRNKNGEIDFGHLQNMVDYAISHGVNYFDTAYVYLGGKSESALGRVLEKHDRSKLFIATKQMMFKCLSINEIESIIQRQLIRLKTDYIDYYLFHMVTRASWDNFKKSRLYDILREKKQKGQIHGIGFSFHDTPEFLKDVLAEYDWDFAQIQLNYLDWSVQKAKEQYEIIKAKRIPIVVMEPVRGGALANLPGNCQAKLNEASSESASAASYAIRWAASFPEVLCVLSGMSDMAQVSDNIETIKKFKPINNEEQTAIDECIKAIMSTGDILCSGCGYCVAECPKNIDIPTMFSLYNSASNVAIKNKWLSFYGHISPGRKANNCTNCKKCMPHCPQLIDIPMQLEKINEKIKILKSSNLRPRAKSQEPRAKSQEPRAKSQEPRAKSQEPRAKSHSLYQKIRAWFSGS